VNVALTYRAVVIGTLQAPVPMHDPDHPANVEPGSAAAVNHTVAPLGSAMVHVPDDDAHVAVPAVTVPDPRPRKLISSG
jgi:hypothetical protein